MRASRFQCLISFLYASFMAFLISLLWTSSSSSRHIFTPPFLIFFLMSSSSFFHHFPPPFPIYTFPYGPHLPPPAVISHLSLTPHAFFHPLTTSSSSALHPSPIHNLYLLSAPPYADINPSSFHSSLITSSLTLLFPLVFLLLPFPRSSRELNFFFAYSTQHFQEIEFSLNSRSATRHSIFVSLFVLITNSSLSTVNSSKANKDPVYHFSH